MFRIKINRIIKYLVISDLFLWTGWGLVTPIFAVFIVEKIEGGTIFVVGMAAAIYWIVKSFLRIPIGLFLDTCPGEKDDFWFLVIGLFVTASVPFGFIYASSPFQIYLLQALYGIGMAMSLSGWSAIFTRHIDKGREATDWGVDATLIGLGTGIAGAVGGWAVVHFGFESVFAAVGIFGVISALVLLPMRNDIEGVFGHGLHFSLKDILYRKKE